MKYVLPAEEIMWVWSELAKFVFALDVILLFFF